MKVSYIDIEIKKGILRLQAYADKIIRVCWSPDGQFKQKDFWNDAKIHTFVDPRAELMPVEMLVTEDKNIFNLHTADLQIQVDKDTEVVSYWNQKGKLILTETFREVSDSFKLMSKTYYSITQGFASCEQERLFGFGNVKEKVGIKGENIVIRHSNTEKRTPMFVSSLGYGILFDITSNGNFAWSEDNNEYIYTGNCTEMMDYYFFYGPKPDTVISSETNPQP